MPILLRLLQQEGESLQNKVMISCLEVLMVLLKDSFEFTMNNLQVKQCVGRLCTLAHQNVQNKAVTLPIIGSLLTLRDKNIRATMDGMIEVDTMRKGTLDSIIRLAHYYAPDLEDNIQEYVLSKLENVQSNKDLSEEQSPRELENRKMKLLTKHHAHSTSHQV